jgi:PTH1 family peptidyl-tRNA hydrolase
VLVVYDEVQLSLGSLKVNLTGGDGGHNGLADILNRMGRRFPRLRLGIGAKPHPEQSLTDYVLGRWTAEERRLLDSSRERILEAMELIVSKGPLLASNTLNQKSPKTKHERPSKPQLQPDRNTGHPGLRSTGGGTGEQDDPAPE